MTGKKVFTGAGEYLASFLLTLKNGENLTQTMDNTLAEITGTLVDGTTNSMVAYTNDKVYQKKELLTLIKNQFRKESDYYKVTNGSKELSPQDMTQVLYNTIKWVETETRAQFEALSELTFDNLATIFKTLGVQNKNYIRKMDILTKNISDFKFFALDDFIGSTEDKSRLYFKFDGATLKICDGSGSNNGDNFKEIFRVTAKEYVANQAYIGDELRIGGTEQTSPFKNIRFMKEIISEGNITMVEGKELIGTALRARFADLAEYYTANMEYRPGTLLQIDTKNQNEVTLYDPSDEESSGCIGIVSDRPGFILNEGLKSDFPIVPVVLTGRSPVRLVGQVSKGDFIYPSPVYPGVAIGVKINDIEAFELQYPKTKRLGQALESSQPIDFSFDENNNVVGSYIQTESLINIKVN